MTTAARPRRLPEPYGAFAPWHQLNRSQLYTLCATAPSRQQLARGPSLRADLAENVGRFYDALWRRAHAQRTSHFATSWAQLAVACGYEPSARVLSSLQAYAALLNEVGAVHVGGAKDRTGAWRRLEVRLLDATAAQGEAPAVACEARRRRETRAQRHARRVKPYVRKGGRGRAVERWSLSWGTQVGTPGRAPTPNGTTSLVGVGARSSDSRTHGPVSSQRQSATARRGAGFAGWIDANERREPRQDDVERQRVRAIVAAALKSSLVTEDQESLPAPTLAAQLDEAADFLAWRHTQLQRLAGRTRPAYWHFVEVFGLVVGGPWAHATGAVAGELVRSAARYDRFALRLTDAGHPPRHPTALAWYAAQVLHRGHSAASPGFAAPALRAVSLRLRREWRQLDDPDGARAGERRRRRDHRRERRIRAMAWQLRAGVELPVSTPPAHRCHEWLAAALREPGRVDPDRFDDLLARVERRGLNRDDQQPTT